MPNYLSSNATWSGHLKIQFSMYIISLKQNFSLYCKLSLVTYTISSLDITLIVPTRDGYALQLQMTINIFFCTVRVLLKNVDTFLSWLLACSNYASFLKRVVLPFRHLNFAQASTKSCFCRVNNEIFTSTKRFKNKLILLWNITLMITAVRNSAFFLFWCMVPFRKNCMIVFVNAGVVSIYILSFCYCSKHKKWNLQILFQPIKKLI